MGIFWPVVWIVMGTAFVCAWGFIVKGCEAMDERNPPMEHLDEPSHDSHEAHH